MKVYKTDINIILIIGTALLLHRFFYFEIDSSKYRFQHWIISDLRPFIIASFYFIFMKSASYKNYIQFLFIVALSNFIVNMIAIIDVKYYQSILQIWQNKAYGIKSYESLIGFEATTTYVASMQERYSGFFLQPSSAGTCSVVCLFFTQLIRNKSLIRFIPYSLLLLMFIINGYLSQSSVFYFGVLLVFCYWGVKSLERSIILLIAFILVAVLTIITLGFEWINMVVFGLRFGAESNFAFMLSQLNLSTVNFFIGFNPLNEGYFGKGLGDSSYLLRLMGGGIFYVILFYILSYNVIMRVSTIYGETNEIKRTVKSLFAFLMLVEVGSGAISNPQLTFIIFGNVFFYGKILNERYVYG
jgi:hypothetical protein